MKKKSLWAIIALAGLTISSCTNDEVIPNTSADNAIEFGTYLGRDAQTKSAALTSTNLLDFGVFASYTLKNDWSNNASNFMFNQKVQKIDGEWVYTPKKYWPATKEEKISFFAYAPYSNYDSQPTVKLENVFDNDDTSAPKVNFTISNDVTKMVDFTAGVVMNKTKTNNTETDEENTVKFYLKHELTRVNFAAKLDRDAFDNSDPKHKTKINITSVKIDKGDDFIASADYTFNTNNNGNLGSWSNPTATTSDLNLADILNKNEASGLGDYKDQGVLVPTTAEVPLFKTNKYLFLISPNNGQGLDKTDVINVTFTYDIITADVSLNGGYVKSTATKQVKLATGNSDLIDDDDDDSTPQVITAPNTLQQGKAYKFTFTFGLHEVKVSAEVTAWSDDTNGGNTSVDWSDAEPTHSQD